MDRSVTTFKRNMSLAYPGIVLSIAIGLGMVVVMGVYSGLRLPESVEPYRPIGYLVLILIILLAIIVLGQSITMLHDDGPKLFVDAQGITDYRSTGGPHRIAWGDIRSMDSNVTTVNGSVTQAQLVLYVVSNGRSVEEVKVNLGGLDRDPMTVHGLIKRAWMEFVYQGGTEDQPE